MERYQKFRKEFPRFYYHGYKIEENELVYKITFDFEIEGLSSFAPTWTFPKCTEQGKTWDNDPLFQKMVFSLGMVAGKLLEAHLFPPGYCGGGQFKR